MRHAPIAQNLGICVPADKGEKLPTFLGAQCPLRFSS
jgi:hypothetical protein